MLVSSIISSLFVSSVLSGVVRDLVERDIAEVTDSDTNDIKPTFTSTLVNRKNAAFQFVSENADANKIGYGVGYIWDVYSGPALLPHTGTVFKDPLLYAIFYGKGSYWTTSTTAIYRDFLQNMGASSYMTNARAITGGRGPVFKDYRIVSGNSLGGSSKHVAVVTNQLAAGLTKSSQGLYEVLVDPTYSTPSSLYVSSSSQFGNHWCGYHSNFVYSGVSYTYGIIGTSYSTPNGGCNYDGMFPTGTSSPNGGFIDNMISTIAHEIAEGMTDPWGNSYYDVNGNENGDKCAWYWGRVEFVNQVTLTGPIYNAAIGNYKYLLQQNWDQSKLKCPQQIWV